MKKPILTKKSFSGVFFLSLETKNIKSIIEKAINYPEIVEAKITDNELHSIQSSSDRSGYFIYQADKRFKI